MTLASSSGGVDDNDQIWLLTSACLQVPACKCLLTGRWRYCSLMALLKLSMNRMRFGVSAVFSLLLVAGSGCRAGDLNASADAVLANYFDAEGPGAAVALIVDGEVRAETAIGYADVKKGIAIDSRTLFDLASVSKHFTAFAALLLEQQGKIATDQPVSRYLPEFVDDSSSRDVRVSDLIHHISGLADYSSDAWQGSDGEFARLTTESHLLWLNEHESLEEPGTVYRYNNSGYVLLSLLVERVSGQRFADFIRTQFFQPAGMGSARVMDDFRLRFPGQARGYASDEDGDDTPSSSPSSVTGDGNIYASLSDMIAWMIALDGDAVLNRAAKDRVWRNGRLDSGERIEDDDGNGYGYGWVIEDGGVVSHSGSWMGTATYVLRDRNNRISVVVLSNDENAEVSEIAKALAALVD